MSTIPNWHEFFVNMAELASSKSKDRSTKVGAVLVGDDHSVLAVGFNGLPRGVNDDIDSRHDRPLKFHYFEHAERNCVYACARHGIRTLGATLYLNVGVHPCSDCARAIIQSGIVEVVGRDIPFKGKGDWDESFRIGREMLTEAGVKLTLLDDKYIEKKLYLGKS